VSEPIQPGNSESSTLPARIDSRAQEREKIARRRRLVAEWRFDLGLTLNQIRDRLARLDPPIDAHIATISRDIDKARDAITSKMSKDFDIRFEFARIIHRYEMLAMRAIRKSRTASEPAAQVAWTRTAKEITDRIFDSYVGIFNKQLAALLLARVEEGTKVDRIASGEELQRYFAENQVTEGELVSEAERAYLYGDEGAARAAESE
jgi:hypothetical protein